jgi:hypothetical protein
MLMWMQLLMGGQALAADCDVAQLVGEVQTASPVAVSKLFLQLAECDKAKAKAEAINAIPRILAGDGGNKALQAAIAVGASDPVWEWLEARDADERSRTLDFLGEQCNSDKGVEGFFVASPGKVGEKYWKERWYRGLAECRTEPIRAMLTAALDDPTHGRKGKERGQFFGILEVYARNLGARAVPTLEELAGSLTDAKEAKLVLQAFGDAANVGSGGDAKAAAASVAAIERLGPNLPADTTIDVARDTLRALSKEDLANAFVKYRWPAQLQDGGYTYLVAAQELVTCKNGKKYGYLHVGDLKNPANLWPDALDAALEEAAVSAWKLNEASKCDGTGELKVTMTSEPVAGEADADAFRERHDKAFQAATEGYKKADVVDESPLTL